MTNRDSLPPVDPADVDRIQRPDSASERGQMAANREQPGEQDFNWEEPGHGPLGDEPPGPEPVHRRSPLDGRASGRVRRAALALEGGGARGAFQVGVLINLYKRGLEPVIITGTSVGALNAAKMAEGRGITGVAQLKELWRAIQGDVSIYEDNPLVDKLGDHTLDRWLGWLPFAASWTFFAGQPWLGAATFPGLDSSLGEIQTDVDGIESFKVQDPLISLVEEQIDPQRVANSGIKLRMASVTRDSGQVRYFTELGDVESVEGLRVREGRQDGVAVNREPELIAPNLADGVIASSAIPMIFKPWLIHGGEYYWDGAVRENVPIRKALELGATDLIVVLTGPGPWAKEIEYSPTRFALVVERVHQVSDPDSLLGFPGNGDFFVVVEVHGEPQTSAVREDCRDFSPYWTFPNVMADISIFVYDDEDPPEICSVSPEDGHNEVRIFFDGETISGDVSGNVGDLIHARGTGDAPRVEIWFRIVSYDGGSSYGSGLPELIQVTPVIRMLQIMGQMQEEVRIGDFDVLNTLDVLHEMAKELGEGSTVSSLDSQESFPLPRDILGRAYALPRYVVIEAPLNLTAITSFDPEMIRANIELGELVAKYTRVGFLDALEAPRQAGQYVNPTQDPDLSDEDLEGEKKHAILEFLNGEARKWRALEEAGGPGWLTAQRLGEFFEHKSHQYRDAQIVPVRRSALPTLNLS